jgi:hypothetical protein
MKEQKNGAPRFAVCIDNSGYPASLELHKIYRVLPDKDAAKDGDVRVIDESGEDYLYPAARFMQIKLPQALQRTMSIQALQSSTTFHSARLAKPRRGRMRPVISKTAARTAK